MLKSWIFVPLNLIIFMSIDFPSFVCYSSKAQEDSLHLQSQLHKAVLEIEGANFDAPTKNYQSWLAIFKTLAFSEKFKTEFWQKAPLYVDKPFDFIVGHFTLENEVRESVEGTFVHGLAADPSVSSGESNTWKFTPINENTMSPMSYGAVQRRLQNSTVYFNNGALLFPKLGDICLASQEVFDFPNTINIYITKPSLQRSLIPHTDKQDVFIIQTQGAKAWKVYAPPSPRKAGADPFARGKGGDEMTEEELGEALLDIIMQPGQMVYIPAGFPHATSTIGNDGEALSSDPSVHLTLGVDTHVWGLSYAFLRWCGFMMSDMDFKLNTTTMVDDVYNHLQQALPFGFLSPGENESQFIMEQIIQLIQKAEPERFEEGLPESAIDNLKRSLGFLRSHHRALTDLHTEVYSTIEVGDVISAAAFVQRQKDQMQKFSSFCAPQE